MCMGVFFFRKFSIGGDEQLKGGRVTDATTAGESWHPGARFKPEGLKRSSWLYDS